MKNIKKISTKGESITITSDEFHEVMKKALDVKKNKKK